MKRRKLTLDALAKLYPVLNADDQLQIVGGGSGTKTDPYTICEIDPLIDNGTFAGGYVKDENGQICYWLGVVTVNSSNSSSSNSDQYEYFDFNSAFLDEDFWQNWGSNSGLDIFFGSEMTNVSGYLDDGSGFISDVGDAIGNSAGNTRIGTDGKFRFETRTGRVFYGNQYVTTTSLEGVGKLMGKYAGGVNMAVTVYNVAAATYNDGIEAGAEEALIACGGMVGGWAGLKIGAAIGSAICPGAGTAAGVIVGTVLGIIGGVGGSMTGSYIVEIGLE